MPPLVSVIIPAYNHEQYINECIGSIINQTYQNIELIVIDDGSKDGTWAKLQELKPLCKKRFTQVIIDTQENQGTCRTLNKLFAKVNGDYIYMIASDDIAKPHAIETQLNFLEKNPEYILAVGNNELIDSSSLQIGWDKEQNIVPLQTADYKTFGQFLKEIASDVNFNSDDFGSYKTLIRGNYIPNGYLYRTDAIKKIGGFTPEAPLEDWYLMLQLTKLGKLKYLDDILFSYRWHENNTMKKKAHIQLITEKTFLYEQELVKLKGNESWKTLFDDYFAQANLPKIKMKIQIGSILKLYRKKTFNKNQLS